MQQMLDELMAHEYTIPLELIVKCKELIDVEKEQMIDFAAEISYGIGVSKDEMKKVAEQYYKKNYNK